MRYFLFVFVLVSQSAFGQKFLSAQIIDGRTGQPVDYVNIGIIDKAQGTVSGADGTFSLTNYQGIPSDTVQFSRIGYAPLKFSLGDLEKRLAHNPVIEMSEEFTELEEVVVNLKEAKKNQIGYTQITEGLVAYWNNSQALGGEHASRILVRKGPAKLEDLSFRVVKNISDSLLVRVNIYEIDKGLPGRNISRSNILYTIKKKSGREIIDLSPYNIVVDDHFIISLEMLKVYGGMVGITIAAYKDGYRSYSRLISQDRWKRVKKGTTIAFNLNTTPVEQGSLTGIIANNKISKPEQVMILWDRSLSMRNRDLEKEFNYLDTFFDKLGATNVQLQTFGYKVSDKQLFDIKNGDWDALKNQLQQLVHDGSTRRKSLQELQPEAFTLIFTDGKDFYEDIHRDWNGRIYFINSSQEANHALLAAIASETGGDYINLAVRHNLNTAADYKRMQGNYISGSLETIHAENEFMEINGNVSDFDDPLEKVLVRVKNTEVQTRTDGSGNFSIQAKPGVTLVFSFPGRTTIEAIVSAGTKNLNIAMPMGVSVLDEVVLNQRIRQTTVQGIVREKKKITTNYGTLDPIKSGFAVRQIDGKELFQGARNIVEALEGKFAGITVVRDYSQSAGLTNNRGRASTNDPQGVARPKNMFNDYVAKIRTRSGFAAWDVDGIFYLPDDVPEHILIPNIKNITIMPGSWAASKYGKEANGGIIIVRTISGSPDDMEAIQDPLFDQAKLPHNYYKGEAVFRGAGNRRQPAYLQDIDRTASLEEAYNVYLELRKNWGKNADFYADIHDHVITEYQSDKKASLILSNIQEASDSNVNAMRLLAYKYEEKGSLREALEAYQTIMELSPNELQSVRDLAHANVRSGAYREGWNLYRTYLTKVKDILKEDGLDQVVRQEMLELADNYRNEINLDRTNFIFNENKEDISVIVQWNNPNAEFELQFVGPTGQFYTWKHTEVDNLQLLAHERLSGSYSKSFGIQDIGEGPWMINSKYLDNKENSSTYLKFTIKDNKNKKETIKVIRLQNDNINYRSLNISEKEVISHF